MKQQDLISAPCCQASNSQKPLLSRSAARGGQRPGLGVVTVLDDCKMNTASWPALKARRPKGPHKAFANSIQVVPKLASWKRAGHWSVLKEPSTSMIKAALVPRLLLHLPPLWASLTKARNLIWTGGFAQVHFTVHTTPCKKPKEYQSKNTLLSPATKKKGGPFGT